MNDTTGVLKDVQTWLALTVMNHEWQFSIKSVMPGIMVNETLVSEQYSLRRQSQRPIAADVRLRIQ